VAVPQDFATDKLQMVNGACDRFLLCISVFFFVWSRKKAEGGAHA